MSVNPIQEKTNRKTIKRKTVCSGRKKNTPINSFNYIYN